MLQASCREGGRRTALRDGPLCLVQGGRSALTRDVFCGLNAVLVRDEALEWGRFRGEGRVNDRTPGRGSMW